MFQTTNQYICKIQVSGSWEWPWLYNTLKLRIPKSYVERSVYQLNCHSLYGGFQLVMRVPIAGWLIEPPTEKWGWRLGLARHVWLRNPKSYELDSAQSGMPNLDGTMLPAVQWAPWRYPRGSLRLRASRFPFQSCHSVEGQIGSERNHSHGLPSGKHSHNYGKSPFFMGKSTINGHVQ